MSVRWTPEEHDAYLSRTAAKRPAPTVKVQNTEPKQAVCTIALAEVESEKGSHGRIGVRVLSKRARLLDIDNIAVKYIVDELRYAGLLRDDSPADIELTVTQEKVAHREDECTLIELSLVEDNKT